MRVDFFSASFFFSDLSFFCLAIDSFFYRGKSHHYGAYAAAAAGASLVASAWNISGEKAGWACLIYTYVVCRGRMKKKKKKKKKY